MGSAKRQYQGTMDTFLFSLAVRTSTSMHYGKCSCLRMPASLCFARRIHLSLIRSRWTGLPDDTARCLQG